MAQEQRPARAQNPAPQNIFENGAAQQHGRAPAASARHLVEDTLFLITVAAFALITTALPAALGQYRFMPIIQAIALTVFVSMAVRGARLTAAYRIAGLWLFVQFVTMTAMTLLLPATVMERAFSDGFAHRQGLLAWIYGANQYPGGLYAAPLAYIVELGTVVVGGLLTAGLLAIWALMRLVNLTAYSVGSLAAAAQGPFAVFIPFLFWHFLRIAGIVCLIPLVALPALTGNWSLRRLWFAHRRAILIGFALIIAALLLELVATPLWPNLMPDDL